MTTDVDHLAELDDPNDPDSDYGRGYRAALDAVLAALRNEAEQRLARAHDLPERAYARGIAYSSYFLEPWLREGAGIVRHLAATTPADGPASTETAESAPAVGREATEAHGGAEDDLVDRAIDYVPLAEHEELRAELAATRNNRLISAIFGHHKDAPRPFALHRRTDVTGVSGTGVVAEGAAFSDGTAVLRWLSDWPTSVVFHDRGMEAIEAVHGHGGATQIVWLSDELEPLAELESERDRLARELHEAQTELVDRTAERDRLADAIRRYEPVIEAAKVWLLPKGNTVEIDNAHNALEDAIEALGDASEAHPNPYRAASVMPHYPRIAAERTVVEAAKAWRAARPGPWTSGADVEFGLLCAVDALGKAGADPGGEQKTAHRPASEEIHTTQETP